MNKNHNAMKDPKELPGKKTTKVEAPTKNPPAPVIETPEPPQVMDPSAPREEKKRPSTSPARPNKKPSKTKR